MSAEIDERVAELERPAAVDQNERCSLAGDPHPE